jgi:glycosyltransferase involved in cell wall biosynthesis
MYEEFIRGEEKYSLSAVVAVSEFLAQKAMANNKYHIPVSVISCGTPIANRRAVYRANPFKIIYAGKLEEVQKRIIATTYALCEVVKNIPGTQVEIYGSGSEQHTVVEIIKQEAEGYDIAFKGLIASDATQTVFSKAQAFVLLSDYEGLPIALMEAMATGLVPVCMNMKSGIPELIIQNNSGILVNNREEEFFAAIKQLKENPLLWQTLSDNAFQKVCLTHAMPVITEKWIALLRELKQKAVPLESLKMPSSIDLPVVNPLLQAMDVRKPSFGKYLQIQTARVLNYISRTYKK